MLRSQFPRRAACAGSLCLIGISAWLYSTDTLAEPLAFPGKVYEVGESPMSIVVGDFDGDGRDDIVADNHGSGTLSVLVADVLDGNRKPIEFKFNPFTGGVKGIAAGDFNRDKKLDLVAAELGTSRVTLLLGDGTGNFSAAGSFSVGNAPRAITVGDFNGDRKLDVATANWGGSSVSVLLGNGSGSFAAAQHYPTNSGLLSIEVGDFNRDGKLDLVTGSAVDQSPMTGKAAVLLGDGKGGFIAGGNVVAGEQSAASIAVGDWNGDATPDLAIADLENARLLFGDGKGSFAPYAPAHTLTPGPRTSSVAVGDFNRDKLPDLAFVTVSSHAVALMSGDGKGGFGAPVRVLTGSTNPACIAVGDFNGDKRADFVVGHWATRALSVFINTGKGRFASLPAFSESKTPAAAPTPAPAPMGAGAPTPGPVVIPPT